MTVEGNDESKQEHRPLLRLIVLAGAFGAGFAIIIGIAVGAAYLLTSRPKLWNTGRITASFLGVEGGYTEPLTFRYALTNHSEEDYLVQKGNDLTVMVRRPKTLRNDEEVTVIPGRTFVPARQTVEFTVQIPYYLANPQDPGWFSGLKQDPEFMSLSRAEKRRCLAAIDADFAGLSEAEQERVIDQSFTPSGELRQLTPDESASLRKVRVQKVLPNLKGFVLFDRRQKLQIDLPW